MSSLPGKSLPFILSLLTVILVGCGSGSSNMLPALRTVNITAVTTYWTPSGSTDVAPQWLASNPYPAALVPQSDGTLQRLQGSANADGSFSIPDVPAGFYWLQINPNANFWTSASDFDFGQDTVGRPLATTAQTTTTFNISVSGLQSSQSPSSLILQSDLRGFLFPFGGSTLAGSTTFTFGSTLTTNIDWSKISALYISQHQLISSGNFTGYVLENAATLPNVSISNGTTNLINATLSASPAASLPLAITGTAWANAAQMIGPQGTSTLSYSDYAAYVQPFLTDRYAPPTSGIVAGGPDLTLLRPASPGSGILLLPSFYGCGAGLGPFGIAKNIGQQPIITDVDYGPLSYGDPYPSNWQRMFQYCQVSTVTLTRPNSTATDTFFVTNKQTTPLPSGPVTPLLTPVQSPMLNGSSFFQPANVSSTNVNISWTAPATGQPYSYVLSVYELLANASTGQTLYASAGRYSTAKTSLSVPFLASGTFVFTLDAIADANANIEKSPNRLKIPHAEAGVVSAPFVIQ